MFTPTETFASAGELHQLAAALRALHARLLTHTQLGFEKVYGRVEGPGALLQLALYDPLFAWLRPLSKRMTELDELAEEPIPASAFTSIKASIAELLEDGDFRGTYLDVLQVDPGVVLAHAALRKLTVKPQRLAA